jgi:ATP-binding cassette subfamily F protein 3
MRPGYCAQEQDTFDAAKTVGEEFSALGARDAETEKLLRRFLFEKGILERRIGDLSGGEVKRLEIARACLVGANFLVLDEPTNHLDIEGREALEEALAAFEGTILVVSHDRWFLEKIAERIILIEDRKLVAYEGGFSEYWRDAGFAAAGLKAAASRGARKTGEGRLEGRGAELAKQRKERAAAPTAGGQRALEARIAAGEKRKLELESEAASAISGRDFRKASRLAEEAEALARLIEKLYEEWASSS